jgi:hypothetical protein
MQKYLKKGSGPAGVVKNKKSGVGRMGTNIINAHYKHV